MQNVIEYLNCITFCKPTYRPLHKYYSNCTLYSNKLQSLKRKQVRDDVINSTAALRHGLFTVDMQVFVIIMSLIKMAMTTMSYQRFKSQKVAGRQYPWIKKQEPTKETYKRIDSMLLPTNEPSEPVNKRISECETENSEPEADRHVNSSSRRSSGLSVTSSEYERRKAAEAKDQPDFLIPMRVLSLRGLTQDDAAGKLVAFLWWFSFILPRMLALSAFASFYPKDIWYICGAHYMITLAFLLYDAYTADIPYYRALFILFTAYVYMFCLIEFKIKFKKVKFIYIGYFILVYLENFIMTFVWYYGTEFYNDWWYKYVYYVLIGSTVLSIMTMSFYIAILKPKKIIVAKQLVESKVL